MNETLIQMPQMDAAGLSENWLLKHCGDQHWRALCAAFRHPSDALVDAQGNRLYASFLAVKGRYRPPLNQVRENDRFQTTVRLAAYGGTLFASTVTFGNPEAHFEVNLVSTFVTRDKEGLNALRQSLPAARLTCDAPPLLDPPQLFLQAKALRRGEAASHLLLDHAIPLDAAAVRAEPAACEPSPYADFNGAGLLYFAAYITLADTLERQMVRTAGLWRGPRDWALAASPVARDVFYHRNLNLGSRLKAVLRHFEHTRDRALLHTQLVSEEDGALLADVFTVRQVAMPDEAREVLD